MARVVGGSIARRPVLSCDELVGRNEGVKLVRACSMMYVGATRRERGLDEVVGRSPVPCVMMVVAGSEGRTRLTEGARGTPLESVTTGEITSPGNDPPLGNGAE